MKLSKKPSAYQRLKAENEKLKSDLSILANHPESIKGVFIKMEWKMKADIETAVWSGGPLSGGVLEFIKTQP